jgi:hypothetical protein
VSATGQVSFDDETAGAGVVLPSRPDAAALLAWIYLFPESMSSARRREHCLNAMKADTYVCTESASCWFGFEMRLQSPPKSGLDVSGADCRMLFRKPVPAELTPDEPSIEKREPVVDASSERKREPIKDAMAPPEIPTVPEPPPAEQKRESVPETVRESNGLWNLGNVFFLNHGIQGATGILDMVSGVVPNSKDRWVALVLGTSTPNKYLVRAFRFSPTNTTLQLQLDFTTPKRVILVAHPTKPIVFVGLNQEVAAFDVTSNKNLSLQLLSHPVHLLALDATGTKLLAIEHQSQFSLIENPASQNAKVSMRTQVNGEPSQKPLSAVWDASSQEVLMLLEDETTLIKWENLAVGWKSAINFGGGAQGMLAMARDPRNGDLYVAGKKGLFGVFRKFGVGGITTPEKRPIAQLAQHDITSLSLSTDANLLALGTSHGEVWILGLAQLEKNVLGTFPHTSFFPNASDKSSTVHFARRVSGDLVWLLSGSVGSDMWGVRTITKKVP